jgi:hypothetical protein
MVTAATIALAAIAPQLAESAPSDLPSGWTMVFDTDLTATTSSWEIGEGCLSESKGLLVSQQQTGCAYTPSQKTDYLSQGFRLAATLAADSNVEQSQVPELKAGTAYFGIAPDGTYVLTGSGASDSEVKGDALNWHTSGFTPNSIRLEWDGPGTSLVAYTNGYKTAEMPFSISASSDHKIELGSGSDAQALYTHVTLASASPQGIL